MHEVDCYDQSRDDWTTCPSLTRDKGSLAGVSVNGRIYAFGGGDGSQCFSDVEIFDPTHGKWIKNQPMLEKVSVSLSWCLFDLILERFFSDTLVHY